MPLDTPVPALFTDEWDRFQRGLAALHPDAQRRAMEDRRQRYSSPKDQNIVRIPAWDDIVHVRPRYTPTQADRTEYYSARRAGRPPALDAGVTAEIERRRSLVRQIANAPDADLSAGFGQIMTAIDNVQDFASTVSTFGRLVVWAAPKALSRLVPGIGWVLLVSDLLNLLSFLGMLLTPAYALLCKGPAEALAAGLPAALFKRALKSETWKMHNLNPLSRTARSKRALRALGRLPTIGGLLEVAQTTDQLFGRGLSLGAIVGLITGGAQAVVIGTRGGTVNVETSTGARVLGARVNRPLADDPGPEAWIQYDAATVLAHAPALLARADVLPDAVVLDALIAVKEAAAVWYHRLRGQDWQGIVNDAWQDTFPVPGIPDEATRDIVARELGRALEPSRWALPGAPQRVRAAEYAEWAGAEAPAALMRWLKRDPASPVRALAGALLGQGVDALFMLAEDDPDLFHWELTTDARLVSSLAESGVLPSLGAPESQIWGLWQAARRELEGGGASTLQVDQWERLAEAAGVPLVKFLPPDAPWPSEWQAYLGPAEE